MGHSGRLIHRNCMSVNKGLKFYSDHESFNRLLDDHIIPIILLLCILPCNKISFTGRYIHVRYSGCIIIIIRGLTV